VDAVVGLLTEDALDLLSGLLDVDEGRRLSVEEALGHPWFDDLQVRRGCTGTGCLGCTCIQCTRRTMRSH